MNLNLEVRLQNKLIRSSTCSSPWTSNVVTVAHRLLDPGAAPAGRIVGGRAPAPVRGQRIRPELQKAFHAFEAAALRSEVERCLPDRVPGVQVCAARCQPVKDLEGVGVVLVHQAVYQGGRSPRLQIWVAAAIEL